MKKQALFLMAVMTIVCLTASAQHYGGTPHYNPAYRSHNYSRPAPFIRNTGLKDSYIGLRLGMTTTDINTDCSHYDDRSSRVGLDAGIVAGFRVSRYTPLYLETGVEYVEKGGKYNYGDVKCNLNYMEVPIVVKYAITPNRHFSVEPYAGGYLASGVSGKEVSGGRYTADRYSQDAFGDNGAFQRFDGGLKIGCGFSLDALYAEVGYEYGLSDINKESRSGIYEEIHNSALTLKVGVNF